MLGGILSFLRFRHFCEQYFKIHLEWCTICQGKGFSESSSSLVAQQGCTYTELIRSFGRELWTSFAVSKSSWYSQVCQDLSCNITILSLFAVGPARGFPLNDCYHWMWPDHFRNSRGYLQYDHVTTFSIFNSPLTSTSSNFTAVKNMEFNSFQPKNVL